MIWNLVIRYCYKISKGETFKEGIFVKGPYSSMQESQVAYHLKCLVFHLMKFYRGMKKLTLPQLSSKDIEVFRQIRLAMILQ